MKQVGTISISAVPAITALERLIALSVHYPDAVAGFVKSMKDGEFIRLATSDENFSLTG